MFQTLNKSVAAVAIAGVLGTMPLSAAAGLGPNDSHSFGTLSGSAAVTVDPFSGSFDNTFSFIQGAFSGASGAVAGFDVVGDMVASFRVGVGATPVWSAWSPTAPVPSDINTGAFAFSQTYNTLTAGETYWFELAGSASEATYTVTLAPVPEPENWALMASGLALMGFVARRRRAAA